MQTSPVFPFAALFLLAAAASAAAGCAPGESDLDVPRAGAEGELAPDAAPWEPPPEYAEGKLLSDLTPEIVTSLRALHAQNHGQPKRFIRVGDSITKSRDFLVCLATTPVTGDNATLEPTRTFFDAAAWSRDSVASKVGWHTPDPYTGNPSPLATEIAQMKPAFAVVMLGTNDAYVGTEPSYEQHLTKLVKLLTDEGIIPVLSTIPPLRNTDQNAAVPAMNRIVRKVAATARVPLMDFHLALEPLPNHGLGSDGVHPIAASTGACDFSATAMKAGYNQRNLLALKALDRVRLAVLDNASELEGDDAVASE